MTSKEWLNCLVICDPALGQAASIVEFLLGRCPAPTVMYAEPNFEDGTAQWCVSSAADWTEEILAHTENPDIVAVASEMDAVKALPAEEQALFLSLIEQAQAAWVRVDWAPDEEGNYPELPIAEGRILAIVGKFRPLSLLRKLGLTAIEPEEEE